MKAYRERGHVRQRGKTWSVVIPLGVDANSGRRKQQWLYGFKTRDDAEKALTKALADLDRGVFIRPARSTVGEWLPHWLESVRRQIRPSTWASYEVNSRVHVVPALGRVKLQKLTPTTINRFYADLLDKGLAPKTVKNVHIMLRRSLQDAVGGDLIAANPAARAKPPRVEPPALVVPDGVGLVKLLGVALGNRLEPAIVTAVGTGLRRGELLGLRWPNVNLDGARIRVMQSLTKLPGGSALSEPKTQRARREIVLPGFVVEVLRRHKAEQNERRLKLGQAWSDTGLVFDRGDGKAMDPDGFSHGFRKLAKSAGFPGMRLHDVRHAFATSLLEQGVHPAIASAVLGHASPSFTMAVYQHVTDGMQEQAAKAIEKAMGG